jgi:autotransporter-associated beta strand protein
VNATNNYTIQGAGSIGGGASILKTNSGTLTISNANTFTGTLTIQAGTLLANANNALGAASAVQVYGGSLQVNGANLSVVSTLITNGIVLLNNTNGLGSLTAPIYVTNSGTLDISGPSFGNNQNPLFGTKVIYVSGWGVNSNGCVIASSTNQENAFENFSLAGDAAIGGNGYRWDVGRPATGAGVFSTGGNPYNLYKVGSNYVAFLGLTVDTNLANIDIRGGILAFQQACSSMGNPSGSLTVEAGSTLNLYNSTTNLQIYAKQFVLNGDGVTANITNENGATTLNGNMTLNGSCVIGVNSTGLTNNCVISGSGSLTKNAGSVMSLTTNETYTGDTTVKAGTLSLVGIASIANSTNITIGSATLDVSSRANASLALNGSANQTLTAVNSNPTNTATTTSTLNGSLTNSIGCTLSLNPNATNFVVLNVTNNAVLLGSTILKVSGTTNDVLAVGNNVTYGGTLTVTNIGAPLVAGNSFKIIQAGTYVPSSFSTLNLPALSSGLNWNTSTLAVNGTISVASSSLIPTNSPGIVGFTLVNPNIVINGTNGQQGGTYYLLQSTDAALPFVQWTPVSTNVVNTNGDAANSFTFTGTNAVNTNAAQQFYILSNTNNH